MPKYAKRSLKRKRTRVRSTRRVGGTGLGKKMSELWAERGKKEREIREAAELKKKAESQRGREELESDDEDLKGRPAIVSRDEEEGAIVEDTGEEEPTVVVTASPDRGSSEGVPIEKSRSLSPVRAEEEAGQAKPDMSDWLTGKWTYAAPTYRAAAATTEEDPAAATTEEDPAAATTEDPAAAATEQPAAAPSAESKRGTQASLRWDAQEWVETDPSSECPTPPALPYKGVKEKVKMTFERLAILQGITSGSREQFLLKQYIKNKAYFLNFHVGICALSRMFLLEKMKMLPLYSTISDETKRSLSASIFKLIDDEKQVDLLPELIRQSNQTIEVEFVFNTNEPPTRTSTSRFGSMLGIKAAPAVAAIKTCQFSFLAYACHKLLISIRDSKNSVDSEDLNNRLLPNLVRFVKCGARFNLEEITAFFGDPAFRPPDAGAPPTLYLMTGMQEMCRFVGVDFDAVILPLLSEFISRSYGGRRRSTRRVRKRRSQRRPRRAKRTRATRV